jgi:hypothetical protein
MTADVACEQLDPSSHAELAYMCSRWDFLVAADMSIRVLI